MAAPATPGAATAQARDTTIIRITPPFMPDAATWDIYRATTKGGIYSSVHTGLISLFKDDTGLTADTVYWYKIRASNGDGDSAQSPDASDKTWADWQTATGKIRAAYNAIRDRLSADSNFKDYFKSIDFDIESQQKIVPRCQINFAGWRTIHGQVQTTMAHSLFLEPILEIKTTDTSRIAENILKATEIFTNAIQGDSDEPTFDNRVLSVNEIDFDTIEITEADGGATIKLIGLMECELQHYPQGNL